MPLHRSGETGGESVGARIRAARIDKKYTQSQLAGKDFSISYISAIERGQIQPSLRALEIIAQRLGLPSSYFFQAISSVDRDDIATAAHSASNHHRVEDAHAQIEYAILEAKVLLMQKRTGQAIEVFEKLLAQVHDAQLQLRVHFHLGRAYLAAGRLHECELALVEAEKLAMRQNDHFAILHCHHFLGNAYAAMYQYDPAIQELWRCLELLEEYRLFNPFWRCDIYNQLGGYYSQINDDEKALAMFKEAAAIANKLTLPAYTQTAFQQMSKDLASADQPRRALLYAHKSLVQGEWHVDPAFMARLYLDLGRAMIHENQDHTRVMLEDDLERYPGEPLIRGAILAVLARWLLAHDQLEQAEHVARQAGELAMPAGASPVAAESLLMLGRVAYAQGKLAEGQVRCEAAIEMLQRLGLFHELNDSAVEFSTLLEQHGQSLEALKYMKLAYETRHRSGL